MRHPWLTFILALVILGVASYAALSGNLPAGLLILLMAAATGAFTSTRGSSRTGSVTSLQEVYAWLLHHGDPAMVVTISDQVAAQPPESILWSIAQLEAIQREHPSVLRVSLTALGARGLRADGQMLRLWLFARWRLRLAAASLYLSGFAYLSADELAERGLEVLTEPILSVFQKESLPADMSASATESSHPSITLTSKKGASHGSR